jgi:WD40 repeat protein
MTEAELRSLLLTAPVPDEIEAQRRTWAVVSAGFEQRERVPWARRRLRPLLALAAVVALLAAAFSPPGKGLAERLREAVAPPAPEPLTLPAPGRLLVTSDTGAWVVQKDGSKRRLGAYDDAVWSPRGLFVGATRGRTLVALEPNGRVRWTLSHRTALSQPRWSPSGFRIAYRSGDTLRVVAGDGTSDRLLAGSAGPAAPAWRPGREHVLAFVDGEGRIRGVNVDTRKDVWGLPRLGPVRQLAWSANGDRLLVLYDRGVLRLFSAVGNVSPLPIPPPLPGAELIRTIRLPREHSFLDVAFAPTGQAFAYTTAESAGDSAVFLISKPRAQPQRLFGGAGALRDLAWSPDGRWLLVGWPDADQWLFLRAPDVRRVITVSAVASEFDPGGSGERRFARIVSWCCAG